MFDVISNKRKQDLALLADLVRKQGTVIASQDLDSQLGCTTTRIILYNGLEYIHIMHNGVFVSCKTI